jgi:hypothetical protein
MAHQFSIEPEALKRRFSAYVVVAAGDEGIKLYVGKTGDNREGCNPMISRCGNHFSYNKIHSQVRNKLENHENWSYTYIFDHFDEYSDDGESRRVCIDRINEIERWLNMEAQQLANKYYNVQVLNPYYGVGSINKAEKERRQAFRTSEAKTKLKGILDAIEEILKNGR